MTCCQQAHTEVPFVEQSGMAKEATVRIMRHLLQPVVQNSLWNGQNSCFNISWRNCFGNCNTELLSRWGQQLHFSRGGICSTASNQPVGEQTQQQYLPLEHLNGLAKYQRQPTRPQKMWWIPHQPFRYRAYFRGRDLLMAWLVPACHGVIQTCICINWLSIWHYSTFGVSHTLSRMAKQHYKCNEARPGKCHDAKPI